MTRLNDDFGDTAAEVGRLENNASTLFNLAAAVQNALRQQIREAIYISTATAWIEPFINQKQISSTTATLDFVAGRAFSTLLEETVLTPTLAVGANSQGSTGDSIASLIGASISNLFTWNGPLLEVLITFPTPTIVNRLLLAPDDYKGYEITTCTTTPDGALFTDVLADLGVSSIRMDATAGKYSGSTVVDFPPRSVLSMRLVLQNQVSPWWRI